LPACSGRRAQRRPIDAPTAFIGSLGQQVLAVIHRPDLPVDGKAAYFRQLLRQDFDLTGISRFVLGPYWRVASPGERQEFSDLLTQQISMATIGA
jgi:phospholipid transport system substrate-binding protein